MIGLLTSWPRPVGIATGAERQRETFVAAGAAAATPWRIRHVKIFRLKRGATEACAKRPGRYPDARHYRLAGNRDPQVNWVRYS
jgi:hypothetical protein